MFHVKLFGKIGARRQSGSQARSTGLTGTHAMPAMEQVIGQLTQRYRPAIKAETSALVMKPAVMGHRVRDAAHFVPHLLKVLAGPEHWNDRRVRALPQQSHSHFCARRVRELADRERIVFDDTRG
jgi:hypothetical protein